MVFAEECSGRGAQTSHSSAGKVATMHVIRMYWRMDLLIFGPALWGTTFNRPMPLAYSVAWAVLYFFLGNLARTVEWPTNPAVAALGYVALA